MGLLDFLSPQAWRRAAAEQVTWDGGWPQASPQRTLKEFWMNESIAIKPVRLPFDTIVKSVTPCVDVRFHFDKGRLIVDQAWVSTSPGRNATSQDGESITIPASLLSNRELKPILQKQADTLRSSLRSHVYSVMVEEREAAGLAVPMERKKRTRTKSSGS